MANFSMGRDLPAILCLSPGTASISLRMSSVSSAVSSPSLQSYVTWYNITDVTAAVRGEFFADKLPNIRWM